MGRITTLYGYIQEYPDRKHEYSKHNQKVLEKLPLESDYPFLNKGMFYVPRGNVNTAQISYWGRLILFGGSFKALEDYWGEWIQKFESLLMKLIWTEARVHVITEWFPEQTCEWSIKWDYSQRLFNSSTPIPITNDDWKFKGLRGFDSLLNSDKK
jgi:hypothetical protein